MSDLANIEALTNIAANAAEIFGIAAGGPLLLFSFIPYSSGLRGYTRNLIIFSVSLVAVGLLVPQIVNWLVPLGDVGIFLALILSLCIGLIMLLGALFVSFLPTFIAFRERKVRKKFIAVLNLLFFIPFAWLIAFIWACIPEKTSSNPE